MALYKTQGIVLNAQEFAEADRLITLLTPGHGKVKAVARGTRRPKSRLAGLLQPFAHLTLLLWQGRSLDGISQAEVRHDFRLLRQDLDLMAHASYACELAGELIREEDRSREAYTHLLTFLRLLERQRRPNLATLYLYSFKMLSLGGWRPHIEACPSCQGSLTGEHLYFHAASGGFLCRNCAAGVEGGFWAPRRVLEGWRYFLRARWQDAARVRVPAELRASLGATLEAYLDHLLERRLKSLAFLDFVSYEPGGDILTRGGSSGAKGEG